ncbi:MAG: NAD(P)H-quinone oxidoreductase subunit 3 [Planctomycetota bacterium]|jgi:NADH-quinone oxidoreductase subunit A
MTAIDSSIGVAAYLALFAGVGLTFLFVNLLVGRFVRPQNPSPEKLEIYECGEPAIGSSFVQFDLRFYVVALLFIIFDVEVAFFFPWATVFGKSVLLSQEQTVAVATDATGRTGLTPDAENLYRELGVRQPTMPREIPASLADRVPARLAEKDRAAAIVKDGMRQLASFSMIDILVFFGVLLVGFAYVWRRGDLNWVRAVTPHTSKVTERVTEIREQDEPVLSA